MLASVTGLAEARIAFASGVEWIDLKDPAAGSLGAVSARVARSVVKWIDGRRPVSATIGDHWLEPAVIPARVETFMACGVSHVKVGIVAHGADRALLGVMESCVSGGASVIAVCFAEQAPAMDDVRKLAATGIRGVMLDTADKHAGGLTKCVSAPYLVDFVRTARECQLITGLAGRLRAEDVPVLLALAPDYLGFRGALCAGGQRRARISARAIGTIRREMIDGEDTWQPIGV